MEDFGSGDIRNYFSQVSERTTIKSEEPTNLPPVPPIDEHVAIKVENLPVPIPIKTENDIAEETNQTE